MCNPLLKQKKLAIEYDVSKEMISNIIKAKKRWLSIDLNSYQASLKCKKRIFFINIEKALALWVENAIQAYFEISDDILRIKAFLCNEEKFKGLTEWIDNFKKCHNL